MAKWKPHVGDVFIYSGVVYQVGVTMSGSHPYGESRAPDKVVRIVSVDTSAYGQSAAIAVLDDSVMRFYRFRSALDTQAALPFIIESDSAFHTQTDFSKCLSTTQSLGTRVISVYCDSYSPELRWFYRLNFDVENLTTDPGGYQYGDIFHYHYSLRSALSSISEGIAKLPVTIRYDGRERLLRIDNVRASFNRATLLDALGRSVRFWRLSGGDGPREIALSVAEVSTGIYFLRLQGDQFDDVNRVSIIH